MMSCALRFGACRVLYVGSMLERGAFVEGLERCLPSTVEFVGHGGDGGEEGRFWYDVLFCAEERIRVVDSWSFFAVDGDPSHVEVLSQPDVGFLTELFLRRELEGWFVRGEVGGVGELFGTGFDRLGISVGVGRELQMQWEFDYGYSARNRVMVDGGHEWETMRLYEVVSRVLRERAAYAELSVLMEFFRSGDIDCIRSNCWCFFSM